MIRVIAMIAVIFSSLSLCIVWYKFGKEEGRQEACASIQPDAKWRNGKCVKVIFEDLK